MTIVEGVYSDETCDSDWDGAFIGGGIGVSPLIFAAFFSEGGEPGAWYILGFVGGIAGFWGGLAVDSAICNRE